MSDLIDRQAAIDAVAEFLYYTSNFDGMRQGFDLSDWKWKMKGVLSDLPSAQRTGRWKVSDLPKGKMKYCSECGFGQYIADERQYNFCPNCGADMRGEQDG